jgi:hypothetical protein
LPFRKKAVAGMQAVAPGRCRGVYDQSRVQVGIAGSRRSNNDYAIRLAGRHAVAIRGRRGERRFDSKTAGGAHDPQRDLTAIGDKDAPQRHCAASQTGSMRKSGWSYSTSSASSTNTFRTVPATPAGTEVKSFITSMRQTSVSALIAWPTET